jgi:hypothetical protein
LAKLTSPPTDRRSSWGLRGRGAAGLAAVVLALAVGFAAVLAGGHDSSGAHARKALVAYQAKLYPLVQEWGRIEVQGMRPAISDLQASEDPNAVQDPASEDVVVPPATVAGEARAWQSGLRDLRAKIAALPAPAVLVRAKRLFDQAIIRYIDAALLFEKAADGAVDQREAGIQRGIDAALDGARLYNEASLVLQRGRRALGLPTSPEFPNKPAGDEVVK